METGGGRRFIGWTFDRKLGKKTQSLSIMTMLQLNVKSAFSLKNSYVYVLVNNETRLRMVYSKQLKGSPWVNTFPEAERWLHDQENQ